MVPFLLGPPPPAFLNAHRVDGVREKKTVHLLTYGGSVFLLAVSLFGALRIIRLHLLGGNDWITGDWLINYQSGFVRRGLSGTALLLFSELANLTPVMATGVVLAALWVITCIATLMLWRSAPADFGRLAILLSPAFLAFDVWDFQGGARKELILFAFLASMLAVHGACHRSALTARLWVGAFTLIPPFLVLMHELVVFTIPLLMVCFYLLSKERSLTLGTRVFFYAGIVGGSSASLIAVLLSPGTQAQRDGICDSLTARGAPDSICNSAISWIGRSSNDAFDVALGIASSPFSLSIYALSAGMALIPFFYFRSRPTPGSIPQFRLLAIATASILPLFAIGADWGRWIHIAVSLCSLVILALPKQFESRGFSTLPSKPKIPLAQGLVIILFTTGWSLDHFGENVFPGFIRLAEAL